MHKPLLMSLSILALGAGMTESPASAQSAKPDKRLAAIGQRQAEMKRAGGAMKILVGFAKGDVEDPKQAKAAGAAMKQVAGRLPRLWPAGTAHGVGKSKAKAEIWTEQAEFRRQLAGFQAAANAMAKASASGDKAQVGAQLGNLGGTCKSCHSKYQVKS